MSAELTKEQAVTLYESKWWENCTNREIALFQMASERLCLPFDRFHEAVEKALGRPVWTHEFANRFAILRELMAQQRAPTMTEIIEMIPPEKRIVLCASAGPKETQK